MHRSLTRFAWTSLAVTLVAAACNQKPEPAQPSVVVGPEPASPMAPPQEANAATNPSTGRIECGSEVCDATTHVCCGFAGQYGCSKRLAIRPGKPDLQDVQPQIESCQQDVKSEYSFDSLWLCDDSTDCPDGHVCCAQELWSGAVMLACVPASPTGELVCDYHEQCAGDTCRTRDTHCEKKSCQRENVRVLCAGKRCDDAAPVCCRRGLEGSPSCEASCEPASAEQRVYEFACSDSSHCPPGAYCQAAMLGSYCAGSLDTANAVVLCATDADCPKDGCAMMGKDTPPKCVEGQRPGFKGCSCD